MLAEAVVAERYSGAVSVAADPDALAEALRTATSALREQVGPWRRLRAALLPRSLFRR